MLPCQIINFCVYQEHLIVFVCISIKRCLKSVSSKASLQLSNSELAEPAILCADACVDRD